MRRMLSRVVLLAVTPGLLGLAHATISPGCNTSTVADAWGPEFAAEAKNFFTELQNFVRVGDKKQFASLVKYPVHVYGENVAAEIANPSELLRRYPLIISADAREAILAQSPDCLLGNGQGVMAARGRIWFQKQANGRFKIITLNVIHPK